MSMPRPDSLPRQPPSSATQGTATDLAGGDGQAPVLQALEEYLGRLINLVEESNNAGRNDAATDPHPHPHAPRENSQDSSAPIPTTTNASGPGWLQNEGNPPDMALPSDKRQILNEVTGAEKFLQELELLIRCFLKQKEKTKSQERSIENFNVEAETQARVEVLRQAMAAEDATEAAREMEHYRSQEQEAREAYDEEGAFNPKLEQESNYRNLHDNRQLMQDIDRHWDAALAENDALKSELQQSATEQDEILVAKKAETDSLKSQVVRATEQEARLAEAKNMAEQLLQQKEELLGKIMEAATDLNGELSAHKKQTEPSGQSQQVSRGIQPPPTLLQEKEALLQSLRQSIADIENELNWFLQEKQNLEENLQRTQQVLQAHQQLHQTLEKSFHITESEIGAIRQILGEMHVSTYGNSGIANNHTGTSAGHGGGLAPMEATDPPASTYHAAPQQQKGPLSREAIPPPVETVDEREWQRDEQSAAMTNASHVYWQQAAAQQQLVVTPSTTEIHNRNWNYHPPAQHTGHYSQLMPQQQPPPQQHQENNYFVEVPTQSTITSGTDGSNVYSQRPSGMSFLQQQMTNAVEEAKHNVLTVSTMPSSPYAPLPSGRKFPLQPAPTAPTASFRALGTYPEKSVHRRENWTSHGAPPTARMPNVVAQPHILHQSLLPTRQHSKPYTQPQYSYLERVENGLSSAPRGWSTKASDPYAQNPASSAGTPTHSNRTGGRPPSMNRVRLDHTG